MLAGRPNGRPFAFSGPGGSALATAGLPSGPALPYDAPQTA